MSEPASAPTPFRTVVRDAAVSAVFTAVVVVIGAGAVSASISSNLAQNLANQATCENPQQLVLLRGSDIQASGDSLTYSTSKDTLTYPPSQLVDGTRSTAWVSKDTTLTQGVGATVTLTLHNEADLRLICVLNGYAKGADYESNASVQVVNVATARGERDATLPPLTATNAFTYQPLVFTPGRTTSVTLTVLVTDPPSTPDQSTGPTSATMSEVELWVSK